MSDKLTTYLERYAWLKENWECSKEDCIELTNLTIAIAQEQGKSVMWDGKKLFIDGVLFNDYSLSAPSFER